jgi:AbiV family abortive infection protein
MKILTEDFYNEGYKLSIGNAKALFKVAKKSAEIGEHGIARSLIILSSEEAVKALFIFFNSCAPNKKFDGWEAIFGGYSKKYKGGHVAKHKSISFFTKIMDYLYEEISKIDDVADYHTSLSDAIEWWKQQKKNPLMLQEALEWWEKEANQEKNKGLYVDEGNDIWHNPRYYTLEQFTDIEKYTTIFIEYVEHFQRIVNNIPGLKEHLKDSTSKNEVES